MQVTTKVFVVIAVTVHVYSSKEDEGSQVMKYIDNIVKKFGEKKAKDTREKLTCWSFDGNPPEKTLATRKMTVCSSTTFVKPHGNMKTITSLASNNSKRKTWHLLPTQGQKYTGFKSRFDSSSGGWK